MHEPGENTQDLRDLGEPHPAEKDLAPDDREACIRRRGRWALIAGVTIPVGTVIATLVAAALAEQRIFESRDGQLFATLAAITLMMLSASLVIVGGIEWVARQPRTLIRRATMQAKSNAEIGGSNRAAIETNNRLVAEAIVTLSGIEKRLNSLESVVERLPDYSKIVADGYRLGRHSAGLGDLDQLADAAPDPGRNNQNNRFDR
jgi:hypothetical protein